MLVGNFCTLATLHASSVKPRWSECALAMGAKPTAEATIPSALEHHLSPGTATAPRNISPVVLQLLCASPATN